MPYITIDVDCGIESFLDEFAEVAGETNPTLKYIIKDRARECLSEYQRLK